MISHHHHHRREPRHWPPRHPLSTAPSPVSGDAPPPSPPAPPTRPEIASPSIKLCTRARPGHTINSAPSRNTSPIRPRPPDWITGHKPGRWWGIALVLLLPPPLLYLPRPRNLEVDVPWNGPWGISPNTRRMIVLLSPRQRHHLSRWCTSARRGPTRDTVDSSAPFMPRGVVWDGP